MPFQPIKSGVLSRADAEQINEALRILDSLLNMQVVQGHPGLINRDPFSGWSLSLDFSGFTGDFNPGTTDTPSVPPPGSLGLPTITVTGAPTWTPGDLYATVWNDVDDSLFVYSPTDEEWKVVVGGNTTPITINYKFGVTVDASVAPTGRIVINALPDDEIPTWTSFKGEVACNKNYVFQGTGTTPKWTAVVPFPTSQLPLPRYGFIVTSQNTPRLLEAVTGNSSTQTRYLTQTGDGVDPGFPVLRMIDAAHITTGTLSYDRGGTGFGTYAEGDILFGTAGGGALAILPKSSDGFVLTLASGIPTWVAPASVGAGTVTSVDITAPAAGITASGGPITTSGSITLALANDLAGLEGLSTTGIAVRTGTSTWTTRSVAAGSSKISVSNGDGVSGNPAVDVAEANLTLSNLGGSVTFAQLGSVPDNDGTLAGNSSSKVPTQQAVKSYVDNSVSGLRWKAAVRVATTANGTLASAYENGDTVDGVTLATGDRILLKNQTTQTENGIYTVNASGSPTRATDADADAELPAATCFVTAGTTNANTVWTCSNTAVTLGATNITFVQVFSAGTYSAGTGLTLSGNQFSVTTNGITYALFQQVAASSLVGNATGSLANATGITLGATLAFSGSALQTAALSGDVSTSANSFVTTIGSNKVTLSMMAQVATATFLGRTTAGTGNVEALTVSQAKSLLNLSGTNTGDQTITLTGAVTGSGTGSFATTLAAGIVGTTNLANSAVTYAKLQAIGANKLLGNDNSGTTVEEIALGSTVAISGATLNVLANTSLQNFIAFANGSSALNPATTLDIAQGTNISVSPSVVGTRIIYTIGVTGVLGTGNIPNLDASKITSGTMATARLGSGTASGYVCLRGDQTWGTPLARGAKVFLSGSGSSSTST